MLALPHRRQHSIQQHHSSSTATPASTTQPSTTLLPSPLSPQTFSLDALSQQLSAQQAQQFVDQKLLNDYLESQQTTFNPQLALDPSASNPFMSASYDFTNPQIRVQQSTPIPQHTAAFSASPMLSTHVATTATGLDDWSTNSYNAGLQDSQTLQTPQQSRSERTHQRAPSSSSIGSAGYQYVAYSEASPLDSARPVRVDSSPSPMPMLNALADPSSRTFSNVASNHLPTPTPTPTQDSFMNNSNSNNFNTYTPQTSNMDSTMAAHMSMKQALMDQHVPDDDVPGFAHSARHSVSSYNGHDSPATPHTTQGDDADFKLPPNGETLQKVDSWLFNQFITYEDEADVRPVPKFERTYTDVAADYSYDPNNLVVQAASIPNNKANALLSPYRSSNHNELIQRSLQAAQMARSQSPSSSASRGDSPFRRGSPYRQPSNNSFSSPRVAVGTAAAAREQKLAADAAHAMKSQVTPSEDSQVKTISPKDALLDYRDADEDSKVPLFPDGGASDYSQQFEGLERYRNTNAAQSGFDTTSQSFQRDNSWATPQFSPNFAPAVTASSLPSSTYAFASPPLQRNTVQNLSSNATSQYRNVSQMNFAPDQNPEFPAHLTSMESSCSEAGGDPSSQSSDRAAHTLAKPVDSKADSGTYTCTYHGCTQRFETPQKLQKHKREGHRNTANLGMGPTSSAGGMTSAALLERNSQAGPHKCERINPTTGKPCNTIFSRPYDLTRHEDTIHNVRKQKVRCALCVEEKTFSRNDALTRHMRVVHPEVDFPGKHRRRGGAHD